MSSRGEKIDGGVRTHVHGFVPPVADLLEVKLDRLELAKASEALGVDVGLVHEHVADPVVARHEACGGARGWTNQFSEEVGTVASLEALFSLGGGEDARDA